ncbi:AMP-binding protein [Diaphorobacter aerolatus]|uniref:AMP-binding protein n=1 Tax=Diaphorobacter aerolatus TaxID=1288495 RepID=A0A7H0GL69_9BURK|nr:AMP-binding protein [Diaphorobacter aerolatus]QNP49035.1 AMP-binding protein [Diaphorobacter aerolatus]
MPEPEAHALAAALHDFWELVHGPLAHWARLTPHATALRSESRSLSFAQLQGEVELRREAIIAQQKPAMLLVDASRGTLECVIEFLAVIASGRCAAVADPEWPQPVHERVQACLPDAPSRLHAATPLAAFYTGFTSGSTGMPKGFMRHHRSWAESFRVGIADFGAVAAQRVLAPGRMSHSLFLFGVMHGLWCGAGALVQEKFSALRCLQWLAEDAAAVLVAVPSQLLLMLQWARQRRMAPIPRVELVQISGARWMRSQTPALKALFPNARIVEFYGASEASYVAWMDADSNACATAVGRPFSNVELSIRSVEGEDGENGLIYLRSPMVFMDYVGQHVDRTGVLRDGDWLSVRDMGHVDEQGLLHLAGRQSRMIVTRGKNLFPEEVETLLQDHPAIARASLQGVADGLRGMQLHAILQWRDPANASPPTAQQLAQWLHARTEAFKLPRQWWTANESWPQTSSGKTDHRQLADALQLALAGEPCEILRPLCAPSTASAP